MRGTGGRESQLSLEREGFAGVATEMDEPAEDVRLEGAVEAVV
jgi:hypothetical protein